VSDVVALCARSYWISTLLASGQRPIASPPAGLAAVSPALLSRGLIYLCVHGQEGDPYLYGDNGQPVLSEQLVRSARLPGSLVYMAGCWGAPLWVDAFLAAGAAAVVADRNVAWAGLYVPMGSQLLGLLWRRRLQSGATAWDAFCAAMETYGRWCRGPRDQELLATVDLYGDPEARLR
jgi:hypothetical protein